MIELGARVQDVVSGFAGIAVGRAVWLYLPPRIYIEPDYLDSDGKRIDGFWIEEAQVRVCPESERIGIEAPR